MARKSKSKGNVVRLDFSDVSANVLLPEGEGYAFKVLSAKDVENDGDGSIAVQVEVLEGPSKKVIGKKTTFYFNKAPQSLWVLANFLAALGVEIPESEVDLDLEDLTSLTFASTVEHNEYKGNVKARPQNFEPYDSEGGEEEEEEVEVKKSKKSRKDDDEEEEEEKPSKKSRKSKKDEDEEEEEEEEKPSKKSKKEKKSKKKKTYAESEVKEMDEDELEALVDESGIDIDLDDFATLRKKVNAVLDALDEAELLEDE